MRCLPWYVGPYDGRGEPTGVVPLDWRTANNRRKRAERWARFIATSIMGAGQIKALGLKPMRDKAGRAIGLEIIGPTPEQRASFVVGWEPARGW